MQGHNQVKNVAYECVAAIVDREKCCGPVWILLLIFKIMFIRPNPKFLHDQQRFNS